MRPYSYMWSSITSFSQSSSILRHLKMIIKDRKTSTDLHLTYIEIHIFFKLVDIPLSSIFEIQIFFEATQIMLTLKQFLSNTSTKLLFTTAKCFLLCLPNIYDSWWYQTWKSPHSAL